MNLNKTDITVILDKSGSMRSLINDTVGGFNSFLTEQKEQPGEATLTLVQFDTKNRVVVDGAPLKDVKELTEASYRPGGNTALLDALGATINKVGQRLAETPEEERPGKVIFLVMTDGEENASNEFTKEQIKTMVEHQTEKYNWSFVFLGANIDSITTATSMGFAAANASNYNATGVGTRAAYNAISAGVTQYRSTKSPASSRNFFNGLTNVSEQKKTTP